MARSTEEREQEEDFAAGAEAALAGQLPKLMAMSPEAMQSGEEEMLPHLGDLDGQDFIHFESPQTESACYQPDAQQPKSLDMEVER